MLDDDDDILGLEESPRFEDDDSGFGSYRNPFYSNYKEKSSSQSPKRQPGSISSRSYNVMVSNKHSP